MTLDEFFAGYEESRPLFDSLCSMIDSIGSNELQVSKSQIAFRRQGRRKPFAWAWIPSRYLRRPAALLVLSVGRSSRDTSPRWKQIVEPAPGRFMHHLEIHSVQDLDDEVRGWLQAASGIG